MTTERRFENLIVQITGAASGFGALAAERFAAQGAKLVLSDWNADGVAAIEKELTDAGYDVISDQVDVSKEDQISDHIGRALKHFGQIDVAINNAGIGHAMAPITLIDTELYDHVMAVNARGVFLGMKHQLPGMVKRGSGAILNVASAAGVVGAGMMSAYAASKHAVVGLTKSAADEVARKNVRVNAICPSFATTPLFNDMADDMGDRQGIDRDAAYAKITSRVPMRRVAEPDEIVQAMVWACDPANSFMTGQMISIDGGLTAV
ncbi:SDR family oxidoreductase [Alphaproteobacteria bacterium]|nr:SDR family oxidoreductase [Alphaproteobacteria bacterium]